MKRFATLCTIILSLLLLSASPAFATTIRVSASAKTTRVAGASNKVVFSARTSKAGAVKVTVYRSGKAIRSMKATRKSSTRYSASWNLRDSGGKTVSAGAFSYRVTATAAKKSRVAKGKVVVPAPIVVSVAPNPILTPVVPMSAPAAGTRWVGYYVPGSPSDMSALTSLESASNTKAKVVNFFVSDSESFPTARLQNVAAHGSIPMITLEFWSIGTAGLSAINNGSKDAFLNSYADSAKAYGGEIWIRPFHEMNGDWYPWGGPTGSNSAAQLVTAWKHVHDVFVARGATNVKFVWCVNNDSVPNTTANAISAYFPGDAYVDYVALDGYNAGNTQSWSSWRPFANCFSAAYATVAKLSAKPIFIAETSSVESGGSKAQWIADMFKVIPTQFPRMVGVCWFNANLSSDWRMESSATSLASFKTAAASF